MSFLVTSYTLCVIITRIVYQAHFDGCFLASGASVPTVLLTLQPKPRNANAVKKLTVVARSWSSLVIQNDA